MHDDHEEGLKEERGCIVVAEPEIDSTVETLC